MKGLIVLICLLFSFLSFSHDKDKGKHKGHDKHHHEHSAFEIIPLNSPVKEANAKFKLVVPASTEISKVFYKIKNASKIFDLNKDLNKREETNLLTNNEIAVSVSKLPPGQYRIHVWIKTKKGEEHHCTRKKQDFAKFVIDESLQVPIPDPKKNDASIGGIDSDNDGIRDDIQRFINETYSNKPNTKEALKQFARASQQGILNTENKQVSIDLSNKIVESISCQTWIMGVDASIQAGKKLTSMMLNTEARIKAELKSDQNYHGQSRPDSVMDLEVEERNQLCDFEAQKELN